MKKALLVVCAAISSVALASSTAFAFCTNTESYNGGSDTVSCNAQSDQATNSVTRSGLTNNYFYTVSATNVESTAGGVLLDSTSSVVSGTRKNGTFGPCNESFSVVGSGSKAFDCRNSNAAVANIRVFAE